MAHPTNRAERRQVAQAEKVSAPHYGHNAKTCRDCGEAKRDARRKSDRAAMREAASELVSWVPSRW